jgi:hypothetical protein
MSGAARRLEIGPLAEIPAVAATQARARKALPERAGAP